MLVIVSAKFYFVFVKSRNCILFNAAFTLNGFDDQERYLTFIKTDFKF